MQANDPDTLLREAVAASQRNDTDTALSLLERVTALAPGAAVAHLLMAGELAQAGRYEEAEAAFARALLADPGLHIARFQLGLLQFTSGNAAVALLTWQPLTELGEQHALSLFARGFAALAGDDMLEATRLFQAGIAANTENAPLNTDIRMVLQRMGEVAGTQPAPATPAPAATEAHGSDTHVLLSNYGSLN
ncbi:MULTISPECIES: tetratricopeptide repeat protein [unclassified Cupriavidus]|uniref:tetratricopeptide repeat protein n=1 Tax=Cupriavidus sp. H19C3 TaxID=3241603 RepID=UPI003BF7EEF7